MTIRILQKIFSQLSFLLIVAGTYGFISTFFIGNYSSNKELSLNRIEGIIVNDSYIYVGLGEFSRVQQYNLKGTFIKGWNTNTYGKDFTFKIDGNTPIVLKKHLVRQESIDFANSKLFDETTKEMLIDNKEYKQILNPNFYIDDKGNEYYVSGLFFKKLIKRENDIEKTIINQSYILNFFNGSNTPLSFLTIGIFIFSLLNFKTISNHMSIHQNDSKLLQLFLKIMT